jgi:hypothetical protein
MINQLPDRWAGYFISVDRVDMSPEIVETVARPEHVPGWSRSFRIYKFPSHDPLAGELPGPPGQVFHYWLMLAHGEQFTLLVSESKRIADVVLDKLQSAHPRMVMRRARIEVHWLVLFLMGERGIEYSDPVSSRLPPDLKQRLVSLLARKEERDIDFRTDYTISALHARLQRQEDLVEKMAFFGQSVWQHDVFQQTLPDMAAYYCKLRKVDISHDVLEMGTNGFVAFPGASSETAQLVISILGYLVSRNVVYRRS